MESRRPQNGERVACTNTGCPTVFESWGGWLWCRFCRELIACQHRHEIPGHIVKRDGSRDGRAWCTACGRTRSTRRAEGVGPACFADHRDRTPCARCGATEGVQTHHWAPRAIFGAEADCWPTAELCPTCHQRWHDLMRRAGGYRLPSLTTGKRSDFDAAEKSTAIVAEQARQILQTHGLEPPSQPGHNTAA